MRRHLREAQSPRRLLVREGRSPKIEGGRKKRGPRDTGILRRSFVLYYCEKITRERARLEGDRGEEEGERAGGVYRFDKRCRVAPSRIRPYREFDT